MPRLAELHKEYADRACSSWRSTPTARTRRRASPSTPSKHGMPFPVLKDAGNVVADQFGARRTPEAFVLDAERRDPLPGPHRRPVRHRLPAAASRRAATWPRRSTKCWPARRSRKPTTPVAGCLIARAPSRKADGTVTYAKHVARILQKNCQECHRPGQIGPMSLLTYDDAAAWADDDPRSGRATAACRRGTPTRATASSPTTAACRTADRGRRCWPGSTQGCPKGDDKDLPPPREFAEGWRIGKPDVVLRRCRRSSTCRPRRRRAACPYQYFVVDDRTSRRTAGSVRAEARPGAARWCITSSSSSLPPGEKFDARTIRQRRSCAAPRPATCR